MQHAAVTIYNPNMHGTSKKKYANFTICVIIHFILLLCLYPYIKTLPRGLVQTKNLKNHPNMNRKPFYKSMAGLLVLAALTGCTTDQEEYHYVNLSQIACTFLGTDNQPLEITVKTSPTAYEASPGATWVKAEKSENGTTLTLTVEDNNTGTERNTVIVVTAGQASQEIIINQLPTENEFARYRRMLNFSSGGVMSPSGRYIGGYVPSLAADDSWLRSPTIIDLKTGEVYEFGPFPEALYYFTNTSCITDQGLLFIDDGYNGGQIAIDLTGNITVPAAPSGFECKPTISETSADGRYWVGYAKEGYGLEYLYKPLLWIDGVPHELPIPDKNFRDEEIWVGVMARGISANGEIIYGTSWENWDFGMLYWVNNGANTEKPKWVGEDVREVWEETMKNSDGTEYTTHLVNGLICQAQLTKISPNGKWIASSYRTETPADDRISIVTTQKAAFFNTETETTVIVEDYGESVGVHVTDDGIAFIGIGTLGISSGKVYDLNTGTDLGDTQDWVYDKYGIIIPAGYINYISPDGRFVLGTKAESSAMGVSFINWYIAPPLAK